MHRASSRRQRQRIAQMDTHHHRWQDKADSVLQRHRLNPKDVFISEVKFGFEVQVMNGSFWPKLASHYACTHTPCAGSNPNFYKLIHRIKLATSYRLLSTFPI
jgi:hypothetical protein